MFLNSFKHFNLNVMNYQHTTFLNVVIFLAVFVIEVRFAVAAGEVIYAINAGGEAHVDVNGIPYRRDPLHGKIGTASDYGKQLIISRVPRTDQILYQTERYHHATFGYEIPVNRDGDYVLVLKFCEVYFSAPGMKVFDIALNGVHTVISDFDIFAKVGKGIAHDEHIPFSIKGNRLFINGEEESEHDGKIKVEFIKGFRDNPKINAIYVMRGTLRDAQQMGSSRSDDKDDDDEGNSDKSSPARRPSGPRSPNPYEAEDSRTMMPVFIAIGAFLPLLFCLCRL